MVGMTENANRGSVVTNVSDLTPAMREVLLRPATEKDYFGPNGTGLVTINALRSRGLISMVTNWPAPEYRLTAAGERCRQELLRRATSPESTVATTEPHALALQRLACAVHRMSGRFFVRRRRPVVSPKGLRETLCLAQSALAERGRAGIDRHRIDSDIRRLQLLINEIDRHRPVRSDGKHGDGSLCTRTCGCEGCERPWSIKIRPAVSGVTRGD